jgi:hypothetical protein
VGENLTWRFKKVKTLTLAWTCLLLTSTQVMGLIQFNDGQTHDIDYGINNEIWVDYEYPAVETTVNWLNGGSIDGDNDLYVYEDCRINISGGAINDYLYVYDRSQINMSSGSISDVFQVYDSSEVTISGGSLGWGLYAHNNSYVNISGGSLGTYVYTTDSSELIFTGGSIVYDLAVMGNSEVTFSGGSIGREMRVKDDGILTIEGTDFAVDGQPFGYGELNSIYGGSYMDEYSRNLTGTLVNGDPIDIGFLIGNTGRIILAPLPPTIFTLTICVEPNDIGIDTVTPSLGDHYYGSLVRLNATQFIHCPDIYKFDYWDGDVTDANLADTTVFMSSDKTVTTVFVPTRECGDECHPYPKYDENKDCILDLADFVDFAFNWLVCTKPQCD